MSKTRGVCRHKFPKFWTAATIKEGEVRIKRCKEKDCTLYKIHGREGVYELVGSGTEKVAVEIK